MTAVNFWGKFFFACFGPKWGNFPQNRVFCNFLGILSLKFSDFLHEGRKLYVLKYEWGQFFAKIFFDPFLAKMGQFCAKIFFCDFFGILSSKCYDFLHEVRI